MTTPVLSDLPFLPQIVASPDVVTALTTFELAMLKAYMGLAPPTLIQMGERETTSALQYKKPVSVGAARFQKLSGGVQYRRVGKLVLPVTWDQYGDGVTAEALDIESDDWKGWGDQPASQAEAANLIGEPLIAAALEAGETTPSVENYIEGDTGNTSIKFHGQGKLVDPFGNSSKIYSNLFTGSGTAGLAVPNGDAAAPLTLANIDRVWSVINTVPDISGNHFMDLQWVAVLVPKQMELLARRYFEDQGDENRFVNDGTTSGASATGADQFMKPNTARKYGIKVYASRYLTSSTTWYPLCITSTQKKMPWIELTQVPARQVEFAGARQSSPQNTNGAGDLQWVIDDFTSEGYKHGTDSIQKGHVGIRAEKRVGVALTWPFQSFKCKAA